MIIVLHIEFHVCESFWMMNPLLIIYEEVSSFLKIGNFNLKTHSGLHVSSFVLSFLLNFVMYLHLEDSTVAKLGYTKMFKFKVLSILLYFAT